MNSLSRLNSAREPIADHEQKKVALGYVHEAWAEARLDGIDGEELVPEQVIELSREYISLPENSTGSESER